MERQQAGPGGPDETSSTLREGIGKLTPEAPGVPEPVGYGLARLEAPAELNEHERQRLAYAQK